MRGFIVSHTRRIVPALLLASFTLVTVDLLSTKSAPRIETRPAIGNVKNLLSAYSRWKSERSHYGEDRMLVLPLKHTKGISTVFTRATGKASLDLLNGSLSVEVSGLPETGGL